MALQIEQVVDGRVEGCELFETSYSPELEHRVFSSPKRKMRVFGPIIRPAPCDLALGVSDLMKGGFVASQSVGHDEFR